MTAQPASNVAPSSLDNSDGGMRLRELRTKNLEPSHAVLRGEATKNLTFGDHKRQVPFGSAQDRLRFLRSLRMTGKRFSVLGSGAERRGGPHAPES